MDMTLPLEQRPSQLKNSLARRVWAKANRAYRPKIYFREYRWLRAYTFTMWLRAVAVCSWRGHVWMDLGDPCVICGSDNCFICTGCRYHTHD